MKERKNESDLEYDFKGVHNGKIQYLLTQHSLFTRKRNRFLLCACNCGAGVDDDNQKCKILTHDEQVQLWE